MLREKKNCISTRAAKVRFVFTERIFESSLAHVRRRSLFISFIRNIHRHCFLSPSKSSILVERLEFFDLESENFGNFILRLRWLHFMSDIKNECRNFILWLHRLHSMSDIKSECGKFDGLFFFCLISRIEIIRRILFSEMDLIWPCLLEIWPFRVSIGVIGISKIMRIVLHSSYKWRSTFRQYVSWNEELQFTLG